MKKSSKVVYLSIIIFFLFIVFIADALPKEQSGLIIILTIIIVPIWLFIYWGKITKKETDIDSTKIVSEYMNDYNSMIDSSVKVCKSIAKKHAHILASERQKYVIKDAYGYENLNIWRKNGVDYFFKKYVCPSLNEGQIKYLTSYDEYFRIIDSYASNIKLNSNKILVYDPNMSGNEYELFCFNILKSFGWVVSLTKSTGDQGVDIIAEKNDIKVVLQCKKHQSRIGNKAVQEVSAGRIYYNANFAIVVSNSLYTPSANQLANTNKVKLLHHTDLENLYSILTI